MNKTDTIATEELEYIKACSMAWVQKSELLQYFHPGDVKVDMSLLEPTLDHYLSIRLVVRMLSERPKDETVSYPADWWQAFKEQYFPEWLLRHFPVKMESVIISIAAIYPTVAFPERHMGGFKVSRIVRDDKPAA
jgi:hypothetical protein